MHSKGNYQQNAKATYRMEEYTCKQYIWLGVKVQNIQELVQLNLKKINNLITFGHKNGQSVRIDILQKKTQKLQTGTEKMLDIN